MDRFEKDSREIPFIAQSGHLDEIAAWCRKLYAEGLAEGEAKLSAADMAAGLNLVAFKEAEAKLAALQEVVECKSNTIMELDVRNAALTAELAERDKSIIAASNAADKAEQNHKRCIAQVESLRRELSKMTAEAGRLREALVIVSSSADDCMLSHGENLCCIREAGLVSIAEEALSPEPEKAAPEVKP